MIASADSSRRAVERCVRKNLVGMIIVLLLAGGLLLKANPVRAALEPVPPRLEADTTRLPSVVMDAGGLTVRSSGRDYALSLGGDVQIDGRFVVGDVPDSERIPLACVASVRSWTC